MINKHDIKRGVEVSCIIGGKTCPVALIQVENGHVYLCQSVQNGDMCQDRLGYPFSWSVGNINRIQENDTESFFLGTEVKNVKLLSRPDWDEEVNYVYHESPF